MVNPLKYLMELYHSLVEQNLQLSILLDQLVSLDTDVVFKLQRILDWVSKRSFPFLYNLFSLVDDASLVLFVCQIVKVLDFLVCNVSLVK